MWGEPFASASAPFYFAFGANAVKLDKVERWASPVFLRQSPCDGFEGQDDHTGTDGREWECPSPAESQ